MFEEIYRILATYLPDFSRQTQFIHLLAPTRGMIHRLYGSSSRISPWVISYRSRHLSNLVAHHRVGLSQALGVGLVLVVLAIAVAAGSILLVSPQLGSYSSSLSSAFTATTVTMTTISTHSGTPSAGGSTQQQCCYVQTVLFGADGNLNETVNLPAYTLIWTSWRLNSTEVIGGIEASVIGPYSAENATITFGVYIDGILGGQSTETVGPVMSLGGQTTLHEPQGISMITGIAANKTQPAGAVITFALIASAGIAPNVNKNGTTPAYEATLPNGSMMPSELPSSTSSIAYPIQAWAYK